ncbi:centrosomal protein of 135 kDa isoform X2 [Corythoichthys intestinalis]|uniref:centrosomal protein of 135 kDa isoform X2 n=1 Tax=Corythoichthys intestinalis TaxID=161448 RepID=UPI0025A533A8|nr:centrosomal protein of 135 kDa isoform X2 [Corythoichthys intestinalis]
MASCAERKFVNLRRRLDQLGYRHPLGIENLPLVEKLFSDLVHTTESLRNAKLAAKSVNESQNCEVLLEPYKADNARLVRENNRLHLELLKAKEEIEHVTRELKSRIRKLDLDMCDIRFLNNQYAQKVRCLEKDSKTKAERILQLQEKNLQAVVQTPGGKKRSIAFRRQRMQTDELIPPPVTSAYPVTQPDDPYIADLLQLADNRILELQNEVTKLKSELAESNECIQLLNIQVGEREHEIDRLNRALHGGRPCEVVALEAKISSSEKLITQLNFQIEYLQDCNKTLEEKVEGLQQKSSSQVADLSLKNFELCQELTQIDDLATRMEMDKEQALEMADVELWDNKEVIQNQKEVIKDLEDKLEKIKVELSLRNSEKGSFEKQLVEVQRQNKKLEETLEILNADKKRLEEKVEKMMSADKDMVLELEAMRAKHGVCGRERSPSRLDAFVKSLEEERDRYRREAEHLRTLRGAGNPVRSPSRSGSPGNKGSITQSDLLVVVRERDLLRTALQEMEEHTEDIQTNVKALSAEKDHFKTMFHKMQEKLQNACQSSSTSDEVLRLKQELRLAESKILQVETERQLLMEEFKVGQTSALPNGNMQEKRIVDMQSVIQSMEQENLDLRAQLFALKDSKRDMEQKLDVQSSALLQSAEEATQQRTAASALRLQQEQMQYSLSDLQNKLTVKTADLQAAHEQLQIQDETIGLVNTISLLFSAEVLRQQVSKHQQDAEVLHNSFSALDKEKDCLQDEVDQKTERLVVLQEELANNAKNLKDVRFTVTAMDKSIAQLQGALNSRERELASLRKQLDNAQMELARLQKTQEMVASEKRNLHDDLTTMTRENQTVHVELKEALRERDELKLRTHSYITKVAKIENLLKTKEQENLDLQERLHTTTHQLQQMEEHQNSTRLELRTSNTERRHLQEAVGRKDLEIQQHQQALMAYETKVSTLARTMARLEEELHKAKEENASLASNLASFRDLCAKLDSAKALTARQATSKSMELERLEGELEDVRSEKELLKKQLASERLTVRNLETLVSSNRQQVLETHLTANEKESELKVLRDRLTMADNKNTEHARDVSNLRSKVSQLQKEMEVLNRQLTSERFERERAVQEMRRQGLSISPLRSSSSLNVSTGSQRTSINTPTEKSDD